MSFNTWVGEDGDLSWNTNEPTDGTYATNIYDDDGQVIGTHTEIIEDNGDIISHDFNIPTESPTESDHIPSQTSKDVPMKWGETIDKILYALIDYPIEQVAKPLNMDPISLGRLMTLIGAGGLSAWGAWRFLVGIPLEYLEYAALGAAFLFFDGTIFLLRKMCFCDYLATFGVVPIVGSVVNFFCNILGDLLRDAYNYVRTIVNLIRHPSFGNLWQAFRTVLTNNPNDTITKGVTDSAWRTIKNEWKKFLFPSSS